MPCQIKNCRETDNPEVQGAIEEQKNEKHNIADNRADKDAKELIWKLTQVLSWVCNVLSWVRGLALIIESGIGFVVHLVVVLPELAIWEDPSRDLVLNAN